MIRHGDPANSGWQMRNLAEYPVTTKEIVECLKVQSEKEAGAAGIGDMASLLLSLAARFFDNEMGADDIDWETYMAMGPDEDGR